MRNYNLFAFSITFFSLFSGCQDEPKKSKAKIHTKIHKSDSRTSIPTPVAVKNNNIEDTSLHAISDNDLGIQVNLKYATSDNFTHQVLYFKLKEAFVKNFVFDMLLKSQTKLSELHPGWHLVVYDAARPLEVQKRMWKALDTIPVKERVKFVSSPGGKSIHNYGCAVDLTILDDSNMPLDMGANYDDIRKIAYPSMENFYLKRGEINQRQIDNRRLLRLVMDHSGFKGISTEWWHFNACTRPFAKKKFDFIESENQLLPRQ